MPRTYHHYEAEKLVLRDWLSADRTVLANERTFLAYARTSLGSLITGITLIKLFEDVLFAQISGWSMIAVGLGVFLVGLYRFIMVGRMLRKIGARSTELPIEQPPQITEVDDRTAP